MSIAERAREVVDTINDKCIEWSYGDTVLLHSEAQEAIEQALLAERRLAMEAILEEMDLDDWNETDEWERGYNDAHKWYAGIIRSKLGGVATPRGGE